MKFKENIGGGGSGIGGDNFLKLTNGQVVTGVFRGEPYDFKQHWFTGHSALCTGANCEHCKAGNKASFRFHLNFITKVDGKYVAKVLEQGWTVHEQLVALNKDYALEKNVVKITRHGSTKNDTSYTVMPAPNGTVTPELEAALAAVPLHVLDPKAQGAAQGDGAPEPGSDFGEPAPPHITQPDVSF